MILVTAINIAGLQIGGIRGLPELATDASTLYGVAVSYTRSHFFLTGNQILWMPIRDYHRKHVALL